MDKENAVHLYTMEYYAVIKKDEVMPSAAFIAYRDEPRESHSK